VPLELPKTEASAIREADAPVSIAIRADGAVFVQDQPTPFEALGPALAVAASGDPARQVFVRADGRATYADVARVMAALSVRGYRNLNLITETGGPPAGPPPQAPAARPGTP
jgi:biopolymer transport protein TolR